MAARPPLVLVSGEIQQLQSGDTLSAPISQVSLIAQTADATLIFGNAVYSSAADHVNKAQANASGTTIVVGLAAAAITSAASGNVQTDGILAGTTTQWDAVAGTTGGLAFNTIYYLDPSTAGKITATPPSTVGQYVVPVGRAISTTELDIRIGNRILL